MTSEDPAGMPTPSLARGAAGITILTAISRLTGFVRVVVVAAAMGTTFLANTYQTANTAPNVLFELVAAGVLTSVFVPTFVEYLVAGRRQAAWDAADALFSVALVALSVLAVVFGLAAPLVMRALTAGVQDPGLRAQEIALGSTWLRLFAPQVVFYGAGMVMTGALHAHRKFLLPALAPIFNNVVVIGVYLAYAVMRSGTAPSVTGITTAQTVVLGAGTTAGVIAMTLALLPGLRQIGWRFRFRFSPSHPAVRRGARVGVWALGYAGGYQAGLIVVLVLANRVQGGVAAYQWAYTFFYLPHALFAAPIFHVLFTAMSEHVARKDAAGYLARLQAGLGMMMFVLVPIGAFLLPAAGPLAQVTLEYGVMTGAGSALVARVLASFAVGLPAYSAFLILTRAYYALGDAKTPALVNAATVATSSVTGALLFAVLPSRWAVPGLALGHSIAFVAGTWLLLERLTLRTGTVLGPELIAASKRSALAGMAALAIMAVMATLLPGDSKIQALTGLVLIAAAGAGVYLGAMSRLGSPELRRLVALARGSS